LVNFLEFVALGVMQEYDQAMLVTQGGKRSLELHYVIPSFGVALRVEVPRQRFETLVGELTLRDADEPGARETAPVVDKVVVHDTAQPRGGFPNFEQIIESRVCLEQHILEQVLGFRFRAREAKSEAVQPLQVWP
jgi:hypothetical protein